MIAEDALGLEDWAVGGSVMALPESEFALILLVLEVVGMMFEDVAAAEEVDSGLGEATTDLSEAIDELESIFIVEWKL